VTATAQSGTFKLGGRIVSRIGFGAMQLAGPGVFGPPKGKNEALAVLREAVAKGVNHIDTSDYYGPHITNQLIREALRPYPDDLVIVTKVGARRTADNLRNLGLYVLELVNFRSMLGADNPSHGPATGSIEREITALAELKHKGLIRHIGVSTVVPAQIAEARKICDVACVQNHYNLAHRTDDSLIDDLARDGIAYVPYFPLGGFSPLQSATLTNVATRLGAKPMQVALAWLLQRAPNILLIPGTKSVGHLRENLAAVDLALPNEPIEELNSVASTGSG
jgi:pyridoxine 4-dehydrogenase